MGERVVSVADAEEGIAAAAAGVGHHERDDAGQVALQRDGLQVTHHVDLRCHVQSVAGSPRDLADVLHRARDAHLDLAHARHVLVELALIGGAESAAELIGIVERVVEHAGAEGAAALDLGAGRGGVEALEETIEDHARVGDLRHRRGLAGPADVARVGAAIARVAAPRAAAPVDAQLQRGEGGAHPQVRSGDLIDADAVADVAVGLADVARRQEGAGAARVIARAIALRRSAVVLEAREHVDRALEGIERAQDGRQGAGQRGAAAAGTPGLHVDAAGHVPGDHALGGLAGRSARVRGAGRLEQARGGREEGQGERDTRAAQEETTPEALAGLVRAIRHGVTSGTRERKGGESTTSTITSRSAPPRATARSVMP